MTYFFDKFFFMIDNLDDLETAGVWASAGHLDSVKELKLLRIDITNVPINIVNSLAKIVEYELSFDGVAGLNFSILKNIKCENLRLETLIIPTQVKQNISFSG